MNCTHPVLYDHPDGLRCHICGALIKAQEDKQQEEKPVEAPKKKRRTKKEAETDGSDSD